MDRWSVGQSQSMAVRVTPDDVARFVALSGDDAPIHVDAAYARQHGFQGVIVHGALLGALVSRLVGTGLPGAHAVLERMDLAFHAPCYAPCNLVIEARIRQVSEAVSSIVLDIQIRTDEGQTLAAGKTWHKWLEERPAR